MLRTLKELFGALVPPPAADAPAVEHTLQLAAVVMLVEVMRADGHFEPAERQTVIEALRREFALGDDETARLFELAGVAAREATDWFAFTSHINQHFDMATKVRTVEAMWRVAYADGHLSEHERHTLWRVADLLHVPQGAYVHARLRAKEAADAAHRSDGALPDGSGTRCRGAPTRIGRGGRRALAGHWRSCAAHLCPLGSVRFPRRPAGVLALPDRKHSPTLDTGGWSAGPRCEVVQPYDDPVAIRAARTAACLPRELDVARRPQHPWG
jgi:uncharacterized tellurite resistance protein B-like protein